MAHQPTPVRTYKILTHAQSARYEFVTCDDPSTTLYSLLAPPPYITSGDSKDWAAIIHAGPDPSSTPLAQTPIVGKITRGSCWKQIFIETGGHVQHDVKKEEKALRISALAKTNKARKFFCMGEKELEWTQEDEDAANDTREETGEERAVVEMVHVAHRAYEFSIDGSVYRWSGTKMHSGAVLRGLKLKGFAISVKLVRVEDHKLVASFEKTPSCRGKQSGNLHFYADEKGDLVLPEQLIALTAFGMLRSEKAKRDLVWEILGEIGEGAGG